MSPRTPSSLPYLIEIFIASTMAALYYTVVELEKMIITDRQKTENSITEATLILVDCRSERANNSDVSKFCFNFCLK